MTPDIDSAGASFGLLIAAALICGAAAPAWADFDDGWAAYEAGDYATALKEFRPLAEQGDAEAQYWLGLMYDKLAGAWGGAGRWRGPKSGRVSPIC